MTWMVLFGLWPLLWLFWLLTGGRRQQTAGDASVDQPSTLNHQRRRRSVLQLGTILLVGLYILNLGYAFDGSFTQLKDFTSSAVL